MLEIKALEDNGIFETCRWTHLLDLVQFRLKAGPDGEITQNKVCVCVYG